MTTEKLAGMKTAIADGKLAAAAGGITVRREQSDKVGFDWVIYTVNTIDVRKDYVPQETPQGTADNPFAYTPGMKLVPNAFYVLDGVRKVWTGAYGVTAAWDDAGFEVM
nr:MAG TPA: hypothetical protein [Caudoviricetes sp.]